MEIFVILLLYIVQGLIFGLAAQHIAESKGYNTGFIWGFFLGVIGLVVVGLKPTIVETYQPVNRSTNISVSSSTSSPSASSSGEWLCECGNQNAASLTYCTRCGREKINTKKIACPHCGAKNKETNKVCFACGKSMTVLTATEPVQSIEMANLLEKLAELHQKGILTDEEFQQKKDDIIKRI